jgi:hypothetical protein
MHNFSKQTPHSVINRLKYETYGSHAHRKVLVVGSGESGFGILSRLRWHWNFRLQDVGLVSSQAVHRVRFGLPLYTTGYYQPIDFERPLIKDFKKNQFDFDEIISISPDKKEIELFWGATLTYDYLILACGRETDPTLLPESFQEGAAVETTDVYDLSTFEGYRKLMLRTGLVVLEDAFSIVAMPGSCQIEEALSLALLLRRKFKENDISIRVAPQHFPFADANKEALRSHFSKRKIDLDFSDSITLNDAQGRIVAAADAWESKPEDLLIVYPTKRVPTFLSETPELAPDNFDPNHLVNKTRSNTFALGSFLFPDCGFDAKNVQANTVIQNFTSKVSSDWFEKELPLATYDFHRQLNLFDNTAKAFALREDSFSRGYLSSKLRAWRLQNRELVKHLYLQRIKPKFIKAEA